MSKIKVTYTNGNLAELKVSTHFVCVCTHFSHVCKRHLSIPTFEISTEKSNWILALGVFHCEGEFICKRILCNGSGELPLSCL